MDHYPYPYAVISRGEKVSKEMAEYQKGSAFERCGSCEYKEGQRCKIVFGYIAPYQVCKYFQKRYSREEMAGMTPSKK